MKIVTLVCFFVLISMNGVLAEDQVIGVVKTAKGDIAVERSQTRTALNINDKIFVGDRILTGKNGATGIIFRDNSILSIGPDSQISVDEFMFDPAEKKLGMTTKLVHGTLAYMSGLIAKLNHEGVRFETPNMVCGTRGTFFAIKQD